MPRAGYKCCKRCGEEKPLDEFSPHKTCSQGRNTRCRKCWAAQGREDYLKHPERERERFKRWRAENPEKNPKYVSRWEQRHPEKAEAHRQVRRAIKKGELERRPCEDCGSESEIHAHHDDYSKPLDVRWLCRRCHTAHHRRERELAGEES